MLTANELRLNNRIRPLGVLNPELTPYWGYGIAPPLFENMQHQPERWEFWGGIPLTAQSLELLGFQRHHGDWTKSGIRIGEYEHGYGVVLKLSINEWISFKAPPILYLHQLQNLYFALTGEELTIPKN